MWVKALDKKQFGKLVLGLSKIGGGSQFVLPFAPENELRARAPRGSVGGLSLYVGSNSTI